MRAKGKPLALQASSKQFTHCTVGEKLLPHGIVNLAVFRFAIHGFGVLNIRRMMHTCYHNFILASFT